MGEWISVKERLPDEEEDVLVFVRNIEHYGRHNKKRSIYRNVFVGWRVDDEWATIYCHGFQYLDKESDKHPNEEYEVTHWMPLPKSPTETDQPESK